MEAQQLQHRIQLQSEQHEAEVHKLKSANEALEKRVRDLQTELDTTRDQHALGRRRTTLENFKKIRQKRWLAWTGQEADAPVPP